MTVTVRRLIFLLLALTLPAHATSLAQTSIFKLIGLSDPIVVAKVLRVVDVPAGDRGQTVKVAEAEVLEWIKSGGARPKRIWYLAEGTRDADRSTAFEDEKVLLFLRIPKGRIEGFDLDIAKRLASPLFWKGVKEVTGGAPLMQIWFSGNGRIPIERVAGVEYGEVTSWLVRLPPDMTTIPVENPWMFDIDRRVPLADLIALARRRLAPIKRPADAAKMLKLLDLLDTDIEAAEAMREGIDKKDIAVLVGLLDDPAFPRRHDVAEALFWIGDAGFDALRVALVSKNVVRRRGAAFAHEWAATSEDMDPDEITPEAVEAAGSRDPDPEFRARMIAALARGGGTDETEPIAAATRALTDKSLRVQRSAARTLLRLWWTTGNDMPTDKASVALLAHAGHADVDFRREVWEALSYFGGPSMLPAALRALGDADRIVRVCAVRALGRTGAARAVSRLVQSVAADDPWVRRTAAYAVGQGKVVEGVDALTKALGDPDPAVVEVAIYALGEIGPPAAAAVPALERLRKTEHRKGVEHALKKIRK